MSSGMSSFLQGFLQIKLALPSFSLHEQGHQCRSWLTDDRLCPGFESGATIENSNTICSRE